MLAEFPPMNINTRGEKRKEWIREEANSLHVLNCATEAWRRRIGIDFFFSGIVDRSSDFFVLNGDLIFWFFLHNDASDAA